MNRRWLIYFNETDLKGTQVKYKYNHLWSRVAVDEKQFIDEDVLWYKDCLLKFINSIYCF